MAMTLYKTIGIMICLVAIFGAFVPCAEAAPPPMTYQGQLKSNGAPVTDTADFRMRLWDAVTGGRVVAGFEPVYGVNIVNGLFTIDLLIDTDPSVVFAGRTKYLELFVAVPAGTGLVSLTPRQPITAAPFATYALAAPTSGVANSPWESAGNDIYYSVGDVAIGLPSPGFPLHVLGSAAHVIHGINQSTTNFTSALYGESTGSNGYGVHGNAPAPSGNATGVFGEAISAGGRGVHGKVSHATGTWAYGVYGEATGFNARGVFGRNTSTTGAAYGVYGQTASVEGFGVHGIATATTGTATAVFGQASSPNGYAGKFIGGRSYFEGHVGVGTDTPEFPLHAISASAGPVVFAEASGAASSAFYGFAEGSMTGVRGESNGTSGIGVSGKTWSATGGTVGVKGVSLSSQGVGVKGENTAGGWAGWFQGDAHISGRLGLGLSNPTTKLDVAGTIKATASSNTGSTLEATNSGTGSGSHAIQANLTSPSSPVDAAAVNASNLGSGYAFYGVSQGTGAQITGNGNTASGLRATATGNYGSGVYAESTGAEGTALYARAMGLYGTAVSARNASTQPCIRIMNGGSGSLIEGRNSANATVFRVTNDGSTSVKLLEITGGADLAEPFDVANSSNPEPGMVVCIDADNAGKLIVCRRACDRTVAGVLSGAGGINPGMIMGQKGSIADGKHPVALTGRVWTLCDAASDPIKPGDLLTTSVVAGHAMRVSEYGKAQGAIIGKAMTPLSSGKGLVLVLVSLQ